MGSHALRRRADAGDHGRGREARPHTKRDRGGAYPVAITVVLTFTHAQLGRDAALAMLRGIVLSWIAFASCFLAIGLSLEALGVAMAICLGILAAVATSFLVIWMDRVVGATGQSKQNRSQ